jgi:hypothetical protein
MSTLAVPGHVDTGTKGYSEENSGAWSHPTQNEVIEWRVRNEFGLRERLKTVQMRYLEYLLNLKNVNAVDIGYKEIKGKVGDKLALKIWVTEKKPECELPPNEILPKEIEGCIIDVIENEAIFIGGKAEQVCIYHTRPFKIPLNVRCFCGNSKEVIFCSKRRCSFVLCKALFFLTCPSSYTVFTNNNYVETLCFLHVE